MTTFLSILLEAAFYIVNTVITIYFIIVIAATILSWVNPDPYNPLVRILRNLTDPVFRFVRRTLPFLMIQGMDLSPIVVLLALRVLQIVLSRLYVQAMIALGAG